MQQQDLFLKKYLRLEIVLILIYGTNGIGVTGLNNFLIIPYPNSPDTIQVSQCNMQPTQVFSN